MKRILVTGGAGYIGSHTAKLLHDSGFEPVLLDNLSTGNRWAAGNHPFFEADLADEENTYGILVQQKVSAIIHFAASAYVGESMRKPEQYFENNVSNGLKLLSAARRAGVGSIVFSSSCATYGIPTELPITEDHPQVPINPYGDSKLFFEKALRWYGDAYGIRSVSLRYFNAAGADPHGNLGECHNPETHIIPSIIEAAMGRRPHFDVFGTDFSTSDGTAIRDYIHVTDLARAHVLSLEFLLSGGKSCAINLGTGQGTSVLELIRAVEKVAKRPAPVNLCNRRPGDPMTLVANNSKALSVLGWQPKYSGLDEIVQTAWRWHQKGQPHTVALPGFSVGRRPPVLAKGFGPTSGRTLRLPLGEQGGTRLSSLRLARSEEI
jgi:UDP-arabinose 4-epimerase